MIEYESVGKTVEDAVNSALAALKLNREDVDIKILDPGGFFRNAKVVILVNEEINTNSELAKTILKQTKIEEPKAVSEVEQIKKFLDNFFKILNQSYTFEAKEEGENIFINIKGDKLADLCGYHGEGIRALQYLLSVYLSKFTRHKKIILDINDFKQKRRQTIEDMANRVVEKVLQTGNPVELQPMNAFERLVVHQIVSQHPELESKSQGEEPKRFLIISKK